MTLVSPEEAVAVVRSGDRVYVGSNCGQPVTLTDALAARAAELRGVEIVHLLTFGTAPYCAPGLEESFRANVVFVSANTREAVNAGRADYVPVFLSDVPRLFTEGHLPIDVAMVAVSPPDEHGYCSLGVSVDIGLAALGSAKTVIGEVQPAMPRTHGAGNVHVSEFQALCPARSPMLEHPSPESDDTSRAIARHVAALVPDGATVQTGFGRLPSAILAAFSDKNDLGVHTEMFSDALLPLVRNGNVTCRAKTHFPGRVVSSFAIGTRALYDEIDDSPFYEFLPTEVVNDPSVIAMHDRMVAINSAIEVDLTGQVVADSIGTTFYTGIGGQVDFVRGAARSKEGLAVIALPSTACGGQESRITAFLKPGAGVVTSRGDVRTVVTEHGVAELFGKNVRQRAEALIQIASPEHRDRLTAEARERGLLR